MRTSQIQKPPIPHCEPTLTCMARRHLLAVADRYGVGLPPGKLTRRELVGAIVAKDGCRLAEGCSE